MDTMKHSGVTDVCYGMAILYSNARADRCNSSLYELCVRVLVEGIFAPSRQHINCIFIVQCQIAHFLVPL